MKNRFLLLAFVGCSQFSFAQDRMTPERLWQLGRIGSPSLSIDGKSIIYNVSTPDAKENKSTSTKFRLPITGGQPEEIAGSDAYLKNRNISGDGKYIITVQDVKINKVYGKDFYPDLTNSNVQIYESLAYRHWDEWEDGAFSHLFVAATTGIGTPKDIMMGEPYDCPQKPFGGNEDYTWSPDSKQIIYVTKRKSGTAYAISTNTDIYAYDVAAGTTTNLSEGMLGYDIQPAFSAQGSLAWLSMKRDGYESDKKDIVVRIGSTIMNLTQQWDGTVESFLWSKDGKKIYFTAATNGTIQLFEVDFPGLTRKMPQVKQLTKGDFDITSIVGQSGNTLVVTRTDMNHAAELYAANPDTGALSQLTHVNDGIYSAIKMSRIEKRFVTTTDNKQMPVWIIYPPDFDATKKYPALLYCQGGPQSALTQFYSFRWNFQLMAANGYIVVAPDRRGMPGLGVAWNEEVSKDWGGQVMRDYLSAIDNVAAEPFVDRSRLGCVGASFGGYSVFYLAGIHQNRFKTFIAHDGTYNMKSMYGTTEELWFVNWDFGGPYWENNPQTQKSYTTFDPSSLVDKWNAPILIFQGEKITGFPLGKAWRHLQQPNFGVSRAS